MTACTGQDACFESLVPPQLRFLGRLHGENLLDSLLLQKDAVLSVWLRHCFDLQQLKHPLQLYQAFVRDTLTTSQGPSAWFCLAGHVLLLGLCRPWGHCARFARSFPIAKEPIFRQRFCVSLCTRCKFRLSYIDSHNGYILGRA